MLTKIHDDLYIDLKRLECISKNEEGKYYLALQNRVPTRITYEHFKTLQEVIDKRADALLNTLKEEIRKEMIENFKASMPKEPLPRSPYASTDQYYQDPVPNSNNEAKN